MGWVACILSGQAGGREPTLLLPRSLRQIVRTQQYPNGDDQGRAGAEVDEMTERVGAHELMAMHIDALFTHDARGRLVRVNEPNGKPAPRFFLGRTPDGNMWRVRHDLGADVVRELEEACRGERADDALLRPPYGSTVYEEILARDAPLERVEAGPAFAFPEALDAAPEAVLVTKENVNILEPFMTPWLGDVGLCDPFLAILHEGQAVSVCGSVRITDRGYEAGVDTHPEFRGRGFAPRVVSAWARAVRAIDRIPLYSTSWNNTASRAVAAKLGLMRFGTDIHIT